MHRGLQPRIDLEFQLCHSLATSPHASPFPSESQVPFAIHVLMSLLTVLRVPLTLVSSSLVLGMAASPARRCPGEQSNALDTLGRPSL